MTASRHGLFGEVVEALVDELQIGACQRDVARYWQFRSTVPGPGLRAASQFLAERHRDSGLEAEVLAYPADDRTESIDGRTSPLEWVPRSASLWIAGEGGDELLCRYEDETLCLVSNSTATPPGGLVADVVQVDGASDSAAYDGLDVEGKIVLTDLSPMVAGQPARERGAAGLVSDSVCPPWLADHPPVRRGADVPDLTMWSVLNGHRQERGLWGFALTPRQGARLRQRLSEAGGALRLRAQVDADLVEGHAEVVSALLPGTDLAEEEVWVLMHSSEPGALDNASGCCLGVELGRALKSLVEQRALAPLRRSIRFLCGVEVEGFLPYLRERQGDLGRVVAGLCLDSVGMDFRQSGGSLELMATPDENASFVDGLLEHLFGAVAAVPNERFGADSYDIFAWSRAPFWGNDGFVGEAYFDIPTPQMSCWPDKFYHSSQDTPDKLSPISMGRAGTIAGAYLYALAAAGPEEARHCAALSALDWKRRLGERLGRYVTSPGEGEAERRDEMSALARHLCLLGADAVRGARVLAPADPGLGGYLEAAVGELEACARNEMRVAAGLAAPAAAAGEVLPESGAAAAMGRDLEMPGGARGAETGERCWRPRRWRRPGDGLLSPAGQQQLAGLRAEGGDVDRVWPWINGRRTAAAIADRLQWGGAIDVATVRAYLELLEREGLVEAV